MPFKTANPAGFGAFAMTVSPPPLTAPATGLSNKEMATRLGISFRTVEIHRAWMMERMGARNLAELVRMEMQLKSART